MIELKYKRLPKSGRFELKKEQEKTLMTLSALAQGRVPYKSGAHDRVSYTRRAPSPSGVWSLNQAKINPKSLYKGLNQILTVIQRLNQV